MQEKSKFIRAQVSSFLPSWRKLPMTGELESPQTHLVKPAFIDYLSYAVYIREHLELKS